MSDIRNLKIEDIEKIQKRRELIEIIEEYELGIKDNCYQLKELKKMVVEKLEELKGVEPREKKEENTININIDIPNINIDISENKEDTEVKKQEKEAKSEIEVKFSGINIDGAIEGKIDVADLTIYKNSDITKENKFTIKAKVDVNSKVYLINENKEKYGELEIITDEEKNYLTAEYENLNLYKLTKKSRVVAVDKVDNTKCYISDILLVEEKELPEFKGTLCIDFGTSNTSVGTFFPENNEMKYVKFKDATNTERDTIPTVVYVENCEDRNDIKYKFGYEAKECIKVKNYEFNSSIFYEIKKWLTDIKKTEEIIDEELNSQNVERKEILKAYLKFILKKAENQFKYKFKKIHFSAPITLKTEYLKSLKTILEEYEIVEKDKSLDEGVAIVYRAMKEEAKNNDDKKRVLIIDIGGGTTDVISASFTSEDEQKGSKIVINTYPENSNSNFGGNDITYRIFQYLKIKIVNFLKERKNTNIDELIKMANPDILESIDKNKSKAEIYKEFEEQYKIVSKVLPTNFNTNDEFSNRKEKRLLKRNFYLLWEIAENIKVKFYESTNMVEIKLDKNQNKDIELPNLDILEFDLVENGELVRKNTPLAVSISIKEIEKLIYGDAYKVICDIFREKEIDKITEDYKKVKLSGQTCKISLFRELLKEYIPGRSFRHSSEKNNNLKLDCINGTILYTSDIDNGITLPEIKSNKGKLKHTLKINRDGEKVVLGNKIEDVKNNIQIYGEDAKNIMIDVYDLEGNHIKNEVYNIKLEQGDISDYTLDNIKNILKDRFEKEQIDSLIEQVRDVKENSTFILFKPSINADTFQVLQFYKTVSNEIKLVATGDYTFEKNSDSTKYFNGEE